MSTLQKELLSIKGEIIELRELLIKRDTNQKEILTASEVMELLNIDRSSFDRLRNEKIIKTYRLKRKLYCKYSEILEALEITGINKTA